jgi:predicted XRE-type DNA-binding protein
MKARKKSGRVVESRGNILADIGLPSPEQEMLKAQLTVQIYSILKDSGMTQVDIARILGVQ